MKKYIRTDELIDVGFDIDSLNIVSIIVVDDVSDYHPIREYITAGEYYKGKDITKMNHDELMTLPDNVREKIRDVPTLRKLSYDELFPMQQFIVYHTNEVDEINLTTAEKKKLLKKVQDCELIYIKPSDKNNDFKQMLLNRGAKLTDEYAKEIIDAMTYRNCTSAKYSNDVENWNDILMIFKISGPFTFPPRKRNGTPVTIDSLKLYIKIDVDHETNNGYVAVSFHESGMHNTTCN